MPSLQRVLSYSESNALKGGVEQKNQNKKSTKECDAFHMYHGT